MNDLNRSIKIFIDGTEASAGVKKVEESIAQLENKIASLDKTEKGYAKKSKDLQKELENKYKTLNTYKQKVEETNRILKNLSGATYDELLAVSQKVRKELRAAVPGTQQYNAALEQNRRVTEAVARAQRAMQVEVGCQASPIGKAVEMFNKYAAVVTTVIAAITGLSLKLNQLREKRNEREDAKADVEALTGLSKDSIDWLEQEAIRLSTTVTEEGVRIRQSATEILDAYKLVGSAKPELLSNKEALAAVTEQTLILASASGMTLKDAVDAVTLSMNQYGAEANQASRYSNVMAAGSKYGSAAVESVTKSIKSSGVAAASANVSVEQLVGTIETLAEKGIKDEIAGTGLKKFFLTLQTGADETNPKIVGLETALDNLQKKQLSAAQIKKMFGEEGYNVASVLISEADKVKYYTEAVTGTGVAIEQAATKSDTAAAKLAQAKNKMNEMGIELMEKLNPSIVSVINGTVNWTRKLIDLIGFMTKHSGLFVSIAATLAVYTATVKLHTLATTRMKTATGEYIIIQKLSDTWDRICTASKLLHSAAMYAFSGNTKMAKEAMLAFFRVLSVNPLAATLAGITAICGAIYLLSRRTDAATKAEMALNNVRNDAIASISGETTHLERLYAIAKDENKSKEVRLAAIKRLNEISPEYLGNLNLENINTINAKKSLDAYITSLIKKATIEQELQRLADINAKLAKYGGDSFQYLDKEINAYELLWNTFTSGSAIPEWNEWLEEKKKLEEDLKKNMGDSLVSTVRDLPKVTEELDKAKKHLSELENMAPFEKKFLDYDFDQMLKEVRGKVHSLEEEKKKLTPTTTPKNDNGDKEDEKRKKLLEKEKEFYTQKQAFLKAMYLEGGDETLQTEKQLNKELECIQMEHLQRSLEIVGANSKEGADIQNQINDLKIKQQREHTEAIITIEKEDYERQQNQLKELYASGQDENLNTEAAYNDAMEQLNIMHLERMLSIAGLNADQQKQIQQQLLDFKVKCMKEEQASQAKAKDAEQKKIEDQTKKERQQYQERLQTYKRFGSELGTAVGNVITGQENAMQGFADTMIDIIFDVIGKIIDAELIKIAASGASAIARSTAEAMAMPDSVASFGATGAARVAILTGLITAAMATAKSVLKGLISGKRSSDTSSSSSETTSSDAPKRATVSVAQWASGRYDVIGEDDGKTYRDVPYIGAAPTGIVRRTSLVSENGAELIVNAEDLTRLQKHINYPLVIGAIEDARNGHVPQRASGNYENIEKLSPNNREATPNNMSPAEFSGLIKELGSLIITLKNLKAYVTLRDIRDAEELDEKSKKPFTRSTK